MAAQGIDDIIRELDDTKKELDDAIKKGGDIKRELDDTRKSLQQQMDVNSRQQKINGDCLRDNSDLHNQVRNLQAELQVRRVEPRKWGAVALLSAGGVGLACFGIVAVALFNKAPNGGLATELSLALLFVPILLLGLVAWGIMKLFREE